MGTRKFALLATATLFATNALAFPMVNRPCERNSYQDMADISSMIQKVSIRIDNPSKDPRGPLTAKAEELHFDAHDIQHIRQAFGFVYCPGDPKHGTPQSAVSGMIIGADDQIVTNRHAFLDEAGRPIGDLSQCYFQNQDGLHPSRVKFKLSNDIESEQAKGNVRFGSLDGADQNADRVVVKLEHAIPGVKAYSISPAGVPLASCHVTRFGADGQPDKSTCQKMALISAWQNQTNGIRGVSLREPIAQACYVRDVYHPGGNHGSVILSDCSSTEGSSASVSFLMDAQGNPIRDGNGELLPVAILVGGASPSSDRLPYDKSSNATKSIALDSVAAGDILAMGNAQGNEQQATSTLVIPASFNSL